MLTIAQTILMTMQHYIILRDTSWNFVFSHHRDGLRNGEFINDVPKIGSSHKGIRLVVQHFVLQKLAKLKHG